MTTFRTITIALSLLLAPAANAAESMASHESHVGEHASASHGERASMPAAPTEEGRMTDAELEENDRRANDPNYEPDPNDPDSCAGGCEEAPPGAEGAPDYSGIDGAN